MSTGATPGPAAGPGAGHPRGRRRPGAGRRRAAPRTGPRGAGRHVWGRVVARRADLPGPTTGRRTAALAHDTKCPAPPVGVGVATAGLVDPATGVLRRVDEGPGFTGTRRGRAQRAAAGARPRRPPGAPAGPRGPLVRQGPGRATFASVATGDMLGVGLLYEGEVLAPPGGRSGAHMTVAAGGRRCTCGDRGCWKTVATTTWLRRRPSGAASARSRWASCRGRPLMRRVCRQPRRRALVRPAAVRPRAVRRPRRGRRGRRSSGPGSSSGCGRTGRGPHRRAATRRRERGPGRRRRAARRRGPRAPAPVTPPPRRRPASWPPRIRFRHASSRLRVYRAPDVENSCCRRARSTSSRRASPPPGRRAPRTTARLWDTKT